MLKVEHTREERTASYSYVLTASTEDQSWHFKLRLSETTVEELTKKTTDLLDKRILKEKEQTLRFIEEMTWEKIKFSPTKVTSFDTSSLSQFPEAIRSFAIKLEEIMQLSEYKPSQKTLEEDLEEQKNKE